MTERKGQVLNPDNLSTFVPNKINGLGTVQTSLGQVV